MTDHVKKSMGIILTLMKKKRMVYKCTTEISMGQVMYTLESLNRSGSGLFS